MKSNNEYIESIFRKKELIFMKKEKERRLKRKVVLAIAPVMLCAIILAVAIPAMLKKEDTAVVYAKDLMNGIVSHKIAMINGEKPDELFTKAYVNFALRLFSETVDDEENVLVSPLSVYIALAMTANGAYGETKAEMEEVFGADVDRLNKYLLNYADSLVETGVVKIANSIWFRNDELLTIKDEFLQNNADYYNAAAYAAPFDKNTVDDINNWVKENTDGMIDSIVDALDRTSMLHLINALVFEAAWEEPYDRYHVKSGIFTNVAGEEEDVEYLYATQYSYLKDDNALGFVRDYQGDYAFVALLPNEGVSVADYVKTLTADKWSTLLENTAHATVTSRIPKFEYDYSTELSDTLKAMGMEDAFDMAAADFSKMGNYNGQNLYISAVIHKTYIALTEYGTKAGAVTDVEMRAGGMIENVEIYLDRPFVYAIIDTNTNLPIFIGTVMTTK